MIGFIDFFSNKDQHIFFTFFAILAFSLNVLGLKVDQVIRILFLNIIDKSNWTSLPDKKAILINLPLS